MTVDPPTVGAIALSGLAVATDLSTSRIPNLLTFPAAACAVAYHATTGGGPGLIHASAGLVAGLLLFLPVYLLRGMGAGDVKLLAALGTWTGAAQVLWVALFAAIAGGVLAILVALYSNHARQLFSNIRLLLTHWSVVGIRPVDALTLDHGRGPRLPYAVPIALGLLWALWVQ